ncbi:S-receptor-like serine/threonine-protein kinase [Parasponia andersonii]|uniref:Receptor-like serine/threonine-protein kinase n=1 Tax=Parasponia andersonii TaxID=3476 RepID=A0A2P5DGX0_PARAD|nr:S-receptor-like serine/threonine-protein kinase [Parasponia andersonii]
MAFVGVLLQLSIYLLSITVNAQINQSNMISLGSSLSPRANSTPWRSPSGLFAFGFYPQGDSFAVGILMLNQPETTVVWTPNRDDPPVSSKATLELTRKGELLLRSEQGKSKSIASISNPASSAAMLDSGNFVLYDDDSRIIWESFDFPTDTILGGQNLTSGNYLVSSLSKSDHSSGRFQLSMQEDGNLVLYPVNSSFITEDSYWASGTNGFVADLRLNQTGFLYLPGGTDFGRPWRHLLANGRSGENETVVLYRATVDSDGIFRLYSHSFSSNNSSRVVVKWSALDNGCQVKGFCGFNSFCELNGEEASCYCFPGFDFIDPRSKSLGCYQNFAEDNCREDAESGLMRYNITTPLENVSWINYPYSVLPLKKELCSKSCLDDCNCWAVSYTSDNCRKYKLPLRYARRSQNISAMAFFKVILGSIDAPNHLPPGQGNLEVVVQSRNAPILILALSLGSLACLFFVFAVSSFVVYKHRARRYKRLSDLNIGLAEDFTLQSFSYEELERATNGFGEEIGKGSFGAVYKGTLSGGDKTIAVKRLEKVVEEGIREFRAEMTTIGRTHHRNLVQLLGFCIEGSKKLLVYEFLSNGSLANLLFKAVLRPSWKERVRFILDVARGVLYLHEECGVHIIHCNLKPQNILLDDTWTAKISDFGFATLLLPNPSKISMRIDGAMGYFAPEWQKNALISVKADVYSFGIVLLETVCCRRNLEVNVSSPDEIILSTWVYNCFMAGELDKLVEDDEQVEMVTLERTVKVGLWCIQDDPALRPLMKNVILMLEGAMDIAVPPPPELPLARS